MGFSQGLSAMIDSSELQRMARLVDMNRQRLEEINQQIERIETVQLEQVAEEFEALFVTQMLKQAYEGKLAEGIFDSPENETYRSLLNVEMGRKLANNSNFGIADALKTQFKNF